MSGTLTNIFFLFWFDVLYALFITALISAIINFWNRSQGKPSVSKARVYVIVLVLLFAISVGNHYIAHARGEKLVDCCERYKQKYGEYPEELTDIVPEFIEEIPPLNYSLIGFKRFYYHTRPDNRGAILGYVEVGFLKTDYDFATKKWKTWD